MDSIVVPLQSRRLERAQLLQKINHAIPAVSKQRTPLLHFRKFDPSRGVRSSRRQILVSYQRALGSITLGVAVAAAWTLPTGADQRPSFSPRSLTAADYAHAEKFMTWNTTPLVFRSNISPTWLPDDRFWYRRSTPTGNDAILVNPATGGKQPCTPR